MEIVDTMVSKEVIGVQTRRERRAYSEQFKAQVIQACKQPGASIAAIALSKYASGEHILSESLTKRL